MTKTSWTLDDAREHFFIYLEQIGEADLLHELNAVQVRHAGVERLVTLFRANLSATAAAATAPFFTAMLGASGAHASAVRRLIQIAHQDKNRETLRLATTLLSDNLVFIHESLEALRTVQQRNFAPDAFSALLRQATVMTWGAFETFCFDVFRLLVTTDLRFLHAIVAGQAQGTPWSTTPSKLLAWINSELAATPSMSTHDAFDSFKHLPSMSLRATRHVYQTVFPSASALHALLAAPALTRLSCRRHLLVHAAGVVDQSYVNGSGESLPIGSNLVVVPRDLEAAFQAVSSASTALARAVDKAL